MSDLFAQLALLKKHIEARDEFEFVSIQEAKNRVLFEDISANFDSPSFSNSALDGYVFAFKDKDEPLDIKGSIFAGDFKEYELGKNEAYKIMTGAKIPKNADTVLMIEDEFIKVKITAQPIENKANKALIEYLAKKFKLPKTSVSIIKGKTSKDKTLLFSVAEKNS